MMLKTHCADRFSFVRQLDPHHIREHIIHAGDTARIEGFQKLFDNLNAEPAADYLHQPIMNYSNNRPASH